MKKDYIIPATIITKATAHEIICSSMYGTIKGDNGEEWYIDRTQPGQPIAGTDGDEAGTKGRGWEVFGEE